MITIDVIVEKDDQSLFSLIPDPRIDNETMKSIIELIELLESDDDIENKIEISFE